MTIRDVVVHVDNGAACRARLEAAREFAKRHQAHLTGIYVIQRFVVPVYAEVPIGQEVLEEARKTLYARADEARSLFESVINDVGVVTEWHAIEGDLVTVLTEVARYVDIVIVGQYNPTDSNDVSAGLVDRLVFQAGRPILAVPYVGEYPVIGDRVMVAWKAHREAVRAVNDSMPILHASTKVDVLSVNPEQREGDIPSADICLHLARHGINAEAHRITAKDIEVGDILLSRAVDLGADMIVMGAYGHSRFRETVLGGVTRHLLRHMTVPIIMSH